MCCCLVVSSESVQQWRWIAKCVLSLTRSVVTVIQGTMCCCLVVNSAISSEVGTAGKVNLSWYYKKCVLSLTECCDCYTGHHVLFDWEALVMNVNSWMYASHVIIGIFLLFLQAPKWKQVARQSQDRPDNFETFTRQTGWELSQDRLENFVTIYHKTDWWLSQDRQENLCDWSQGRLARSQDPLQTEKTVHKNWILPVTNLVNYDASFISLCHLCIMFKKYFNWEIENQQQ